MTEGIGLSSMLTGASRAAQTAKAPDEQSVCESVTFTRDVMKGGGCAGRLFYGECLRENTVYTVPESKTDWLCSSTTAELNAKVQNECADYNCKSIDRPIKEGANVSFWNPFETMIKKLKQNAQGASK